MSPATMDPALWDALRACARALAPDLREGKMFGSPALYVGRRMACCVHGHAVGLRVPASMADVARTSGRARHFTPHGRPPMREWIALDLPPEDLHAAGDLISAALTFAQKNNERAH
jgi:hypothetical protein